MRNTFLFATLAMAAAAALPLSPSAAAKESASAAAQSAHASAPETAPASTTPEGAPITEGEGGHSTLLVRVRNYYDVPLPARIELWPATGRTDKTVTTGPRSYPHSTLPVLTPSDGTQPAAPDAVPAPTPAPPPSAYPEAARSSEPLAPVATGRSAEELVVDAGVYDVVVNRSGIILVRSGVELAAGKHVELFCQFGGLRIVHGESGPWQVLDEASNLRALVWPGRTLDVAPGTWALRSRHGRLASDIRVLAGDVTLVDLEDPRRTDETPR